MLEYFHKIKGTLHKQLFPPMTAQDSIRKANPLRIVIGSSNIGDHGWIKTNQKDLNLLKPQDWKNLFGNRQADAMLAEHVWEHLTETDGAKAFKLVFQYLKPGGYLRIAVPDGFHPDPAYIDWVKVGGSGPGSDDHHVLYNHEMLEKMLTAAGFSVQKLEYFDSKGQFHFQPWKTEQGTIRRSKDHDTRNKDGKLNYTSLIVDAIKPV